MGPMHIFASQCREQLSIEQAAQAHNGALRGSIDAHLDGSVVRPFRTQRPAIRKTEQCTIGTLGDKTTISTGVLELLEPGQTGGDSVGFGIESRCAGLNKGIEDGDDGGQICYSGGTDDNGQGALL